MLENTGLHPTQEPAMHAALGTESLGKILPLRAIVQDPENPGQGGDGRVRNAPRNRLPMVNTRNLARSVEKSLLIQSDKFTGQLCRISPDACQSDRQKARVDFYSH